MDFFVLKFFGIVLISIIIALTIYLIPAIIAFGRKCVSKTDILIFNILTGWSGVGYFAALIWAIVGKRKKE